MDEIEKIKEKLGKNLEDVIKERFELTRMLVNRKNDQCRMNTYRQKKNLPISSGD